MIVASPRARLALRWTAGASLALAAACDPASPTPPARRAGTPADAVWAGGVDGGDWIRCRPTDARELRYACQIYNDYSGALVASGEFLLRRESDDTSYSAQEFPRVAAAPDSLRYSHFDGEVIRLRDGLALIPDGAIDAPFGDGHGKRQRFREGVPIGDEVQY